MKRDDIYGSGEWIKVKDGTLNIDGKPKRITLTVGKWMDVQEWDNGNQRVVSFVELGGEEGQKLGLNKTNWNSIAEISGHDDDANWPGTVIELYVDKTDFNGNRVDCVRIREAPAETTAPASAHLDTSPIGPAAASRLAEKMESFEKTIDDLRACLTTQGVKAPAGELAKWPKSIVDQIKVAVDCEFDIAAVEKVSIPF